MAALIWDNDTQSFKQSAIPCVWDVDKQMWVDTTGRVWDEASQSWVKVWEPALIIYSYGYNPYEIKGAAGYAPTTIMDDHLHMENRGGNRLETFGGSKLITGIDKYNTLQVTFSRSVTKGAATVMGFNICNYSYSYEYPPVGNAVNYGTVKELSTKDYTMVTMTAPLNSNGVTEGYLSYGTTNGNSQTQIIDVYEVKLVNI